METKNKRCAMTIKIYHNPRCSKSRQTLQILRSQSDDIAVIEYLEAPPTYTQMQAILALLQMSPRDLMRKNEPPYRDQRLDRSELSDKHLIEQMIQHPILIERPIVLANGKAVIGRPPECVTDIL